MPDFDLFDMGFDGDVEGIDFLGFDYLMRRVLGTDRDEDDIEEDDDSGEDTMSDGV